MYRRETSIYTLLIMGQPACSRIAFTFLRTKVGSLRKMQFLTY